MEDEMKNLTDELDKLDAELQRIREQNEFEDNLYAAIGFIVMLVAAIGILISLTGG